MFKLKNNLNIKKKYSERRGTKSEDYALRANILPLIKRIEALESVVYKDSKDNKQKLEGACTLLSLATSMELDNNNACTVSTTSNESSGPMMKQLIEEPDTSTSMINQAEQAEAMFNNERITSSTINHQPAKVMSMSGPITFNMNHTMEEAKVGHSQRPNTLYMANLQQVKLNSNHELSTSQINHQQGTVKYHNGSSTFMIKHIIKEKILPDLELRASTINRLIECVRAMPQSDLSNNHIIEGTTNAKINNEKQQQTAGIVGTESDRTHKLFIWDLNQIKLKKNVENANLTLKKSIVDVQRQNQSINMENSSNFRPYEIINNRGEKRVIIGPNYTTLPYKVYSNMRWMGKDSDDNIGSYATRTMMRALFDREELATKTLSGKPSPAFKNSRPLKEKLDEGIINDITFIVMYHCHISRKTIRKYITSLCADESKRGKRANKNRQKDNK